MPDLICPETWRHVQEIAECPLLLDTWQKTQRAAPPSGNSAEADALQKKNAELRSEMEALTKAKEEAEGLCKALESQMVLERSSKHKVGSPVDVARCLELTRLVKECVDEPHFEPHRSVTGTIEGENRTTIGIAYDDATCIISDLLVGGPAYNSKQVKS